MDMKTILLFLEIVNTLEFLLASRCCLSEQVQTFDD